MISKAEYAARRKDLMSMMGDNSIAVIASASEKVRSKDTCTPKTEYKSQLSMWLCRAECGYGAYTKAPAGDFSFLPR